MTESRNNFIIRLGDKEIDLRYPIVMAILNVTDDSFWSGSRCESEQDIIATVDRAVQGGATIVDVGGYSSRPGAKEVDVELELERVRRGVKVVRERYPQMAISIDTFRSEVAERIIGEFGGCIVNDISAGELDADMIGVVARLGVPYVAMHMRSSPDTMQQHTDYDNVTEEVKRFFIDKIAQLRRVGVRDIIIDPGFGFAKTTQQNYQLIRHMEELKEMGCPILSGVSRKSMIYNVLESTPAESGAGTAALNWESLRNGASILRVHDVQEAADIIRIYNYYIEANERK